MSGFCEFGICGDSFGDTNIELLVVVIGAGAENPEGGLGVLETLGEETLEADFWEGIIVCLIVVLMGVVIL